MKVDLKSLTTPEAEIWARKMGMEPYRGRQIRHWLFKNLTLSFDDMTNLSRSLPRRTSLLDSANRVRRVVRV